MVAVGGMDLWTLFVVYTFGGFWPAAIGIAAMLFVIMLIGRISMYTILNVMLLFFAIMSLGYWGDERALIAVPIIAFIIGRAIWEIAMWARGRLGL